MISRHGDGEPGDVWEPPEGPLGYVLNDDCTLHQVFMNSEHTLSPDRVWANGGHRQNAQVQNAINQGYAGSVEATLYLDTGLLELQFTFDSLAASQPYRVWVDSDGGSPFPFTNIGTFWTDASGEGSFFHSKTLPAGPYLESFWVNQATGHSILQTDPDIGFTVP